MNWIRLSLAALLLQAPITPQSRPPERASITGFVVKVGTSEPLSKATVVLNSTDGGRSQTYSSSTSAGGQFLFENVQPGKYHLSATRNGYVRYEFGARGPNRPGLPVTVASGQKITEVVLPLMPAATITGRVFDRDGEPLANVVVQALKYSYQDGQRVLNAVQAAETNDLGEYRLFWLNPGQYFVGATYPQGGNGGRRFAFGGRGGNPAPSAEDEGYVPVYYPGTTDPQSAAPISLQAAVVFSGVDLTVAPVRTGKLRVQVIDSATGQPTYMRAQVALVSRQRMVPRGPMAGNLSAISRQGQGIFEIRDVVPGSYELFASIDDKNNRRTGQTTVEIGNSDVQNVTVSVSPGFTLPGRLTVEGNAITSNMRVMLSPILWQMMGGGGPGMGGGGQLISTVQADGTFALQQVGQDAYRIMVTGIPRNAYIKAARLGTTDVLNEGLHLERQPTGPLEIVISSNTGSVDATVLNERQEPAINVTVVLVPDPAHRSRQDLYRTGSTDATGRLHLEGVPPGDYKAFAWEDVESGAWQDPDFIRQYEERGKPLRVGENGQANIELRIIPPQL